MPSVAHVVSPLKNRQFALLFGGQAISLLGDGVLATALPIYVLVDLNGSALDLAVISSARLLTLVIFLMLGGAITDRVSRRLAMLTADAVRGVVILTLGILAIAGELTVLEITIGSLLLGAFAALFMPASTAMLPEVVADGELMAANSLTQISRNLSAQLVGPVLGAVIATTVGASTAMIFDAATFAASAGCLALMRPTPRPTTHGRSILADVRAGLSFCVHTPWLIWTLVVAGLGNAVVYSPFAVTIPLLFKRALDLPAWTIGVAFAFFGFGSMVGALVAGMISTPRHRIRVMWCCWIGASAIAVVLGLSQSAWLACAALVAMGPPLMVGNIIWESLIQKEVPRELLGRVSSVDWTVSLGAAPIGVLFAGVVANAAGVRITIVVPSAIIAVLGAMFLALFRPLTEIDRRQPVPVAS